MTGEGRERSVLTGFAVLALLTVPRAASAPEVSATPHPPEPPAFYTEPVRTAPAPGYFRPRREFSGLVVAVSEPPRASHRGRAGTGVWIEPPDRPMLRPRLPQELHGGDRIHTGPTARARVLLPGGAVVHLGPDSEVRLAGEGPERKPSERVRIGVHRGLVRVEAPFLRPLEIEVPHGLFHLVHGQAVVRSPPGGIVPGSVWAEVHLVEGRGRVHGRGPARRRSVKLEQGQVLRWDEPGPELWVRRYLDITGIEKLQAEVGRLEDATMVASAEPTPPVLPAARPRPLPTTRVVTLGGPDPSPGPSPPPSPTARPTRVPTKPPTPKPTPSPTPKPTPRPSDPFGPDDPFADEDPFGDEGEFDF